MKKILLFSTLILLLFSCQSAETAAYDVASTDIVEENNSSEIVVNVERKLIKNGSIAFEVSDLEKTRNKILTLINTHKAYISNDNEYNNNSSVGNSLTIRVPANSFEKLIAAIGEGVERFDNKNISVEDVTAKFLDVDARLRTKKELENRYLSILQKATKVSEIIEIEQKLGEVRGEIESTEGQLNYLKNQVAFSTLEVNYYVSKSPNPMHGSKLSKGFKNGWNNLIMFFIGMINIWPFVILFIIGFLWFRHWRKKKVAKK